MSATIIKPKRSPFRPDAQQRIVANTMTALAKDIKVDFDVTTQTWEHRPKVTIEGSGIAPREIAVAGEVYAMLDAGTKPHLIRPRRGRVLRFRTPFRSKTVPNQIMSRGGSQGATEVWARAVRHPGTKPRNWAKTIAAKWRTQAPIVMQRALHAEVG